MPKEEPKNAAELDLVRAHYRAVRKMAESMLSANTGSRFMRIDENLRSLIFSLRKPWGNYIIICFFLLGVYLPNVQDLNEEKIISQLHKVIRRCKNEI